MALAATTPLMAGGCAAWTGRVCGKVSRAARGVGAVDAAGTRGRPGRAFGWPFTAAPVTGHG
jgi:hypothetical protein